MRRWRISKVVEYLGRTGAKAAEQVAYSEAAGYFSRALELLRRLPDGAVRDRQELDLQLSLSWSLFVSKGQRAPEIEPTLVRARELGEQLGENAKLMEALLVLAHYHRRDFEQARQLAEMVIVMAKKVRAPAMLAGAHYVVGGVLQYGGQFPAAREHLERAVELFGAGRSRNYGAYFAQAASNVLVGVLVVLGYLSTALSGDRPI